MEVAKRPFPDKSGRLCFDSVEFLNTAARIFLEYTFNNRVSIKTLSGDY
ncbi:hypothetical protein L1S32_03670 [Methanogenium sp. S4BF]|nr:hypothetical protein [Methanogenium sp. S4BF]WFN35230.1 hypothetical protein L1S32_03670 [Methanogenium sp. S4BF]